MARAPRRGRPRGRVDPRRQSALRREPHRREAAVERLLHDLFGLLARLERHLARVASRTGHYHVDVLAGPRREYVRGPTLQREPDGRYRVFDDLGFAGAPDTYLSEALPLPAALQQALVLVRRTVPAPVYPLWGAAPWKTLGYRRNQPIGDDGLPSV